MGHTVTDFWFCDRCAREFASEVGLNKISYDVYNPQITRLQPYKTVKKHLCDNCLEVFERRFSEFLEND